MATIQAEATGPNADTAKTRLLQRYSEQIVWYRNASGHNRRSYKATRCLLTVLGALVTVVSSLSSAKFVTGGLAVAFAVLTPLLAAGMAIVGGISQAFQWGAAWSDAATTAVRLERDRDRIEMTPAGKVDALKEMALLDDAVLVETQGFFQCLLGPSAALKPGIEKVTTP
jgi:hypothetical protein